MLRAKPVNLVRRLLQGPSSHHTKQWRHFSVQDQDAPVMAIRREDYGSQWERRAPLNPLQVKSFVDSGVKVLVQPSNRRAYTMEDYLKAGAVIQEDLMEASLILGVKQVPIQRLLANKTYCFFSHTIKAQSENMPLLDAILDKNIRLIDYEKIVDENGKRLVAFGKFAGIAGMLNILHGIGLRLLALGHHTPFIHIAAAHNYRNTGMAMQAVRDAGYRIALGELPQSIGPMSFVFMGSGNVSQGAQEVIADLPVEYVEPHDLRKAVEKGDHRKVYATEVHRKDHIVKRGGRGFNREEYDQHPELYRSTFSEKIAPWASCIINGIFWNIAHPRFLTKMDTKTLLSPDMSPNAPEAPGCPRLPHRLLAICDITADPGGSIEFIEECSSIESPFDLYDANHKHQHFMSQRFSGDGVLVCSIDNMPAQLPREATDFFGNLLTPLVPEMLKSDATRPFEEENLSRVIKDAVITSNGKLTENFQYLTDLREATMPEKQASFYRHQAFPGASFGGGKQKVLMFGSGYMAEPIVEYLARSDDIAITVASAEKPEADALATKYNNTSPMYLNVAKHEDKMSKAIQEHDMVISMLPFSFHPRVAKLCVENKKNMVTASYACPEIRALQQGALNAGVTIMNECGLDPGIDHMLAMEAFHRIKEEGGKIRFFDSWCGGLPAPEHSENPLRYKFNWSAVASLGAVTRDAKYLKHGEEIYIPPGMLMDHSNVQEINFLPGFNLEGYFNRDSTQYVFAYGIPTAHTVQRGTLRYKGFCKTVTTFPMLGLMDTEPHPALAEGTPDITWHELMCKLLGHDTQTTSSRLERIVFDKIGQDEERLDAILKLGLLSETIVNKQGSIFETLSAYLSHTQSYENGERDLVIMKHRIGVEWPDKITSTEEISMTVYGDAYGHSAMAKMVGYPAAIAAKMIMDGEIVQKGVVLPFSKDIYHLILNRLKAEDIRAAVRTVFH
ncbi:alpha-aminoadipic semialdehyde synthase, mitochondrial-like isoform X1 [Asterias rubens]|uniref:alpha-aminoadipic semialdehyde synthase, mitochondrial-like isoform X1 n=1 Tax=Asterias rubens TaxID=7604 RepID=UPI001455574E|nr:alpha-aminoadipic semialdehyde synthase, mitochondrial-like isoform X1 [Asterias rubens]XP_033646698.1 alpha-aminoadipic semialdehyde synthase, mitochondrial-like isoform X1 [Asterias rubens]XP_033646699.1 alpha-aminoadipic semialdehyde synthase, mitochondrial-like isoform X1 [Asterias rubens]